MKKKILFLIMVIGAMSACFSGSAYAASNEKKSPSKGEIERKFFEGCLSSANSFDKYNLYKKCIGKFSSECVNNFGKYEDWIKDVGMGSGTLDCMEVESQLWSKLFDKQAKELRHKVYSKEKDKEITDALEDTLAALKKRPNNYECNYDSISRKEWNPARLYAGFSCILDITAESAIAVYILNSDKTSKYGND